MIIFYFLIVPISTGKYWYNRFGVYIWVVEPISHQRKEIIMKKKLLSIVCLFSLLIPLAVGCGGRNSLKIGKPYSLESNGAKIDISVNSATRTTLLEYFNSDTDNNIIYIDCSIKLVDPGDNFFLTAYDFEGNVRVKSENGDVADYFEYSLPDDKTVVELKEGENVECSFPVVLPAETKRVVVDLYDGESFSNEITLKIE